MTTFKRVERVAPGPFKRVEQLIFDKVCKHLAQQKERSIKGDTCAYRSEDGMKCAVGALLPDSLYKEEFEGSSAAAVCEEAGWLVDYRYLLTDLQVAHDFSYGPEDLREELHAIASARKLNAANVALITEWEGKQV